MVDDCISGCLYFFTARLVYFVSRMGTKKPTDLNDLQRFNVIHSMPNASHPELIQFLHVAENKSQQISQLVLK